MGEAYGKTKNKREGGGGGNLSKLPNKVKGQLASKQIYTEKKGLIWFGFMPLSTIFQLYCESVLFLEETG